ncbi:MAG: hypothetical protein ACTSQK_06070 [Candidatus Heimdallarchaeota archaeon]
MAISGFVILMISVSAIVAIGSLIFSFIMIWNFSKKKTMGTALLAFFYGAIAMYHIIHSIMMSIAAQNPFSLMHKILFVAYVATLLLSYFYLYVFACRHILRDNDLVKSAITIVMLAVNAVIIGIMGYELIMEVPSPIFSVISLKPEWGISHYIPVPLVLIILYLTCVLFVELRIIFRLSLTLVKKETETEIQRKGLQYILFGILSLFASVLLTILISLPNISNTLFSILYILRGIFTLLGLLLSYIGWILPEWFVRRVRKAGIVSNIAIDAEIENLDTSSETFNKPVEKNDEITEM